MIKTPPAGCFDGNAHPTCQCAVKLAYVVADVLEDAFLRHATARVQNRQRLLTGMQVTASAVQSQPPRREEGHGYFLLLNVDSSVMVTLSS